MVQARAGVAAMAAGPAERVATSLSPGLEGRDPAASRPAQPHHGAIYAALVRKLRCLARRNTADLRVRWRASTSTQYVGSLPAIPLGIRRPIGRQLGDPLWLGQAQLASAALDGRRIRAGERATTAGHAGAGVSGSNCADIGLNGTWRFHEPPCWLRAS